MKGIISMEVTNISFAVIPSCRPYRISSVSFVLQTQGAIRLYPLSLVYSHSSFQSHFKGDSNCAQVPTSVLQKILNQKNQHCLSTHETCTFSSHTQSHKYQHTISRIQELIVLFLVVVVINHYILLIQGTSVVPILFGTRDWFQRRQFLH